MIRRLRDRRRYVGRHSPGASCCGGVGEPRDPWQGAPLFPDFYDLRYVRR